MKRRFLSLIDEKVNQFWSKTRAEKTEHDFAKLLEYHLRRFRYNIALDFYHKVLENTPNSDEGDKVEGNIALPTSLNAWSVTLMTRLSKRRGTHRKRMYAVTY